MGVGKTPPKIATTSEFVTKEGSYKLYFQKHLLAATKEDTRVLKQNAKIDYSLQDIWNGKGIKGKLNRFYVLILTSLHFDTTLEMEQKRRFSSCTRTRWNVS